MKVANIAVSSNADALDKLFSYIINDDIEANINIGQRVLVPFGKTNKLLTGYIISIEEPFNYDMNKLKYIHSTIEEFPILSYFDLLLIDFLRDSYFCTYTEAISIIIPKDLKDVKGNKIINVLNTGKELEGKYLKEIYQNIWNLIKHNPNEYTKNSFSKTFNISSSSINTLLKKGFIIEAPKVVYRYDNKEYNKYDIINLNSDQKNVFDKIMSSEKKKFLIRGVTGSGKTEIYMHLVGEMLECGKDSIILVPEIALTPQMIERFKGRFGSSIAVFHSKLSQGERFDQWQRVKRGEVKIAIGTRSAALLPFNNIGMIIIDEEHEPSYKSDFDPKYKAHEVCEFRCSLFNAKLVLGSATPSLETYLEVEKGETEILTLEKRVNDIPMPKVTVIDLREELRSGNRGIFSTLLKVKIAERLKRKEQIILFLNRRGFSTFVSCRSCGYVFKCSRCDISLTYHFDADNMKCHYCGETTAAPKICPKCSSKYVKYFGIGTQKVEEEIKRLFPGAKAIRMDFDTTRKSNSYEEIYSSFKNNEADILIGTQMVVKGLDFKNVTLVGVIAADLTLNLPDYKSSERTFQLICQVAGRSGRGEKEGEVIVQTYCPDHFSIVSAVKNDYLNFYNNEIQIRKLMEYPPFTRLLLINLSSKIEKDAMDSAKKIHAMLKDENILGYNILGPSPCPLYKIKDNYRYQIMIKDYFDNDYIKQVKKNIYNIIKSKYFDVTATIDLNPNSLL
ncbi:MAG: primosomal protein N' [Oscillospiraceae bacterium]|nr:primosomal protein N' [Oscillospiraceae bacterium]